MTIIRPRVRRWLRRLAAVLLALWGVGSVHAQGDARLDARPLASRDELERVLAELDAVPDPNAEVRGRRDAVRARLTRGDFRPGDLVFVDVMGEPALLDTFVVQNDITLRIPPPALGVVPLQGVLRSELDTTVKTYFHQFLRDPVVVTRPLIRLAIEGEVGRAGYYAVPADLRLSDVLMVADGVTPRADLDKVTVARAGRTVLDRRAARRALTDGATVDDLRLRDGDAVTVGRDGVALEARMRMLWLVVSLTGGIYGLTQIF